MDAIQTMRDAYAVIQALVSELRQLQQGRLQQEKTASLSVFSAYSGYTDNNSDPVDASAALNAGLEELLRNRWKQLFRR